ncbi:MAG: hypothetical protein AAF944_16100 [Bacteroidota bacterium]
MTIQRSLVLMIFLALSLSACSDDDESQGPPPTEFTEATLVLNGEPLEFNVAASDWECHPGNLTLGIVYISENLEKGIGFSATNFPAKEGRYTLRKEISIFMIIAATIVVIWKPHSAQPWRTGARP